MAWRMDKDNATNHTKYYRKTGLKALSDVVKLVRRKTQAVPLIF